MKKTILYVLMIMSLAGLALAGSMKVYPFVFTGRWQPSEDPALIEDYGLQDIQNLRRDGKRYKGVSGQTEVNDNTIGSYHASEFTEYDPNSKITITSDSLVTLSAITGADEGRVYIDNGVNYYSGDFTFRFKFNVSAANDGSSAVVFALTNNNGSIYEATINGVGAGEGPIVYIEIYRTAGTTSMSLVEYGSGGGGSPHDISIGTTYYVEVYRDEDIAGDNGAGKVYCDVYSDAGYATLLFSLDVSPYYKNDYRYLYWAAGTGSSGTATMSLTVEDLTEEMDIVNNGFNFKKDFPSENHTLVDISNGDEKKLMINDTAPPSADDFDRLSLHNNPSAASIGRFSNAPRGNMLYTNVAESLIWGGDEIRPVAFLTSTADITGGTLTNAKDYSIKVQNSLQEPDEVAYIGGGNDSGTVLLLHMDGADASTTFTDSSTTTAHTMTAAGDAQIDTAYRVFSESGKFDGTGDYLTTPDDADFNFASDPLTVDFWFMTTGDDQGGAIFEQYTDANNYISLGYYKSTVHNFVWSVNVDGSFVHLKSITSFIPESYTWYHLALIRGWGGDANTWAFCVNGEIKSTWTNASAMPDLGTATFDIGRSQTDGASYFKGWIDELRISKGVARWAAEFTPPVMPYRADANYFLVGSTRPIQGTKFYISDPADETGTLTAYEWNGSTWKALTITDNTTGLTTTGTVTFGSTVDSSRPKYIYGHYLYWYKFALSAGDPTIYQVSLDAPIQPVVDIWDGSFLKPGAFQVYKSGAWYDYSEEVLEETTTAYADSPIAADLNSLANTEFVYIGLPYQITAVKFNLVAGKENSTANDVTVSYWDGDQWQSVGTVTDETDSGPSLAQSGIMSWNAPDVEQEFEQNLFGIKGKGMSMWTFSPGISGSFPLFQVWNGLVNSISESYKAKNESSTDKARKKGFDDLPLYYYKFQWSAAMDSTTMVDTVVGIPAKQTIKGFKFPLMFQNRAFLCGEESDGVNRCIYSMSDAPDVWNGSDSGALVFGDDQELTVGAVLYNLYRTSGIEQMIICKAHEAYRVFGSGPDSWEVQRMSGVTGCVAPLSMTVCDATAVGNEGLNRQIAIWQTDSGVVMCDGATIEIISNDIKCYWDKNDARSIPADRMDDSFGWYDPNLKAYKLLISSGTGQTVHNVELEYSLQYNEWTKIDRGSATNDLQCGFLVEDISGNTYSYGGNAYGTVFRLENSDNFNGTANTQYLQTKDLLLGQSPFFQHSVIEKIRLGYKAKWGGSQSTTDYPESDPAGRIELTDATTVTVTTADNDEEFYVARDFTAGYFSGNFELYTQVKCTSNPVTVGGIGVWAVTNTMDSLRDIDVANGDWLSVWWYQFSGNQHLAVSECNNGTIYTKISTTLSLDTEYYLKIVRDEDVGTFGTIYCYIYSDSSLSTLVDTLTLPLTEKQDFRYLNWVVAYESGETGKAWSGTITDLGYSPLIEITHYCDGTATMHGANDQYVPDAFVMADGPYKTIDCNLGECLYHSFKFSSDIYDTADGMELTGLGIVYTPFDALMED